MPGSEALPDTLVAAVDRWAETAPHRTAVRDTRASITFAELHDMSTAAAARLRHAGVRPGDRVAVAGEKTARAVAVMLGAMRCGAAFVPLDPKAPVARLASLLQDAEPAAVAGRLPASPGTPSFSIDDLVDSDTAGAHIDSSITGGTVAYCMYTSGSSGRPKGVQIDHRAIMSFIDAVHGRMQVGVGSRCLNTSPFFFDVSVVDTWYPLAMGATVHLADHMIVPDRVLDVIERERISHFSAVGSILTLLRRAARPIAERDLGSVVRIMTGAEIVDPATVGAWLEAVPQATIFNGYGPTEATCCCFAHPITTANADTAPYPIGAPFSNTDVLVLGPDDDICPPGTPGELLIAGPQVTRGYLRRPEEDERRFLHHAGRRWYRTGDVVVEDPDGLFHFRGRRDHELKVRGYRIHPAEITAALYRCEGVVEAHVTTATDERQERVLAAAVAAADGALVTASSLRAALRAQLPDYMVPRIIRVLDVLPKLPSGKIDDGDLRARLAAEHEPA